MFLFQTVLITPALYTADIARARRAVFEKKPQCKRANARPARGGAFLRAFLRRVACTGRACCSQPGDGTEKRKGWYRMVPRSLRQTCHLRRDNKGRSRGMKFVGTGGPPKRWKVQWAGRGESGARRRKRADKYTRESHSEQRAVRGSAGRVLVYGVRR